MSERYYDRFMSALSKTWVISPIHSLVDVEATPGVLSLLAGKPNSTTFPITKISLDISSSASTSSPSDEVVERVTFDEQALKLGLQYGTTTGQLGLLNLLTEWQCKWHGLAVDPGRRLSLAAGASDLLFQAIKMILDPGDVVLVEDADYCSIRATVEGCSAECLAVPVDDHGIVPESLQKLLAEWPAEKPKPKCLYTMPVGTPLSGSIVPLERRLQILALAREHEFLILEDDPFYHISYGTGDPPPSYLALEAQDRESPRLVIRFDSFSHILGPGLRIGFVTGPFALLEMMERFAAVAILQPPSIGQSIVHTILSKWGIQGFKEYCQTIGDSYRSQRDRFIGSLSKQFGEVFHYSNPQAGPFLWLKLRDSSTEPLSTQLASHLSETLPNTVASTALTSLSGVESPYLRVNFSLLAEADITKVASQLMDVASGTREVAAHA